MEKRNDWEKLSHIIEEYEPDPDLALRAIEKINQRESTVAFKKAPNKQAIFAASVIGLVIAVFLAIFLPLYLTRNRVQILLYCEDEVEYSVISDIDSFVASNNLQVEYFTEKTANNRCARIKSNGEIAYIIQELLCVSDNDFDIINLKVVVLKNAEFEFNKNFRAIINSLEINNIRVEYNSNSKNNQNIINCKFNYRNVSYFLEITTSDNATQTIEKYVNMLIN